MLGPISALAFALTLVGPGQCNPPPGSGPLVGFQPAVLPAPSGLNPSNSLPPPGVTEITTKTFVVEFWAQQTNVPLSPGGLGGEYVNLNFTGAVMACGVVASSLQYRPTTKNRATGSEE